MTKYASLLFISGLAFLLLVITGFLPLGQAPMLAGNQILNNAAEQVGAANIVTSVVLAYRGLDTLGELSILFAAASVVGLVLRQTRFKSAGTHIASVNHRDNAGFVAMKSMDLIFPLFLIVGMYMIVHGHLTPGGGFQGGVILAIAFSMRSIVNPRIEPVSHTSLAFIESFAGFSFILIGLIALFTEGHFLQPLLGHGEFLGLWSAGTLPLLYLAVGLKVGAELAALLFTLNTDEGEG